MDDETLKARLQAFKDDIVAAMDQQPIKYDADGNELTESYSPFDEGQQPDEDVVEGRDDFRSRLQGVIDGALISLQDLLPGRAPIGHNDRPVALVDELRHDTLEAMEEAGLMKARLDENPWSDDYWAIYTGQLGKRYADASFPSSKDWEENRAYIEANPASAVVATGDPDAINELSPSEKYDLLIGDMAGTLTKKQWDEGRYYYERDGEVATWMGICHGWAPAAYMLPRPRSTVRVPDFSGRMELTFYPADIKALASLLWANDAPRVRFSGGRCNDKQAERDPETGRVLSPACFDTNPGTWHMAMVNQLGVSRRSLVMDATFDYEVWNQPVCGYEYRYFNPFFLEPVATLEQARMTYSTFESRDPFKEFRKRDGIESVVGVMMKAYYVVETHPRPRETDDESRDIVVSVGYLYDLELDADGRIMGGEWYGNKHPDFLWTPPPDAKALTSAEDFATDSWWGGEAIPASWRSAALRVAAQGSPLAKIVEALIELANA